MNRVPAHLVVLLISLVTAAVPGTGTGATLIDRILLVVDDQPITQSRVDLYRDYLEVTGGTGLGWPRPIEDVKNLAPDAMLEIVVIDELLFDAATRVNVVAVRDRDVEARLAAFRGLFPDEAAFQSFEARHGWNLEMEREFFSRRLRVEGYIRFKLGFEVPDDATLRQQYEADASRWGGRPFLEVRDQVLFELFEARCRKDFDRWVASLRERADVVVPTREIDSSSARPVSPRRHCARAASAPARHSRR